MAEVKILEPPAALYDFVLFWEADDTKNWIGNPLQSKRSVKGDGSLVNLIDWDTTFSNKETDKGGNTLLGVTQDVWQNYVETHPSKGYSMDLNKMGKQGWFDVIDWYWYEGCGASKCANYACAIVMFQMRWLGFSPVSKLANTLKEHADIKDYSYTTSKVSYNRVADATHAYTNPMEAFNYMRDAMLSYYMNLNSVNTYGWLNRSALCFTPYGWYIPTIYDGVQSGIPNDSFTLNDWEMLSEKLVAENTTGHVKIMDWGEDPVINKDISYDPYSYALQNKNTNTELNYQSTSSNNTSGVYAGNNNVPQLGGYGNDHPIKPLSMPIKGEDGNYINLFYQNKRQKVLFGLINGAYSPKSVKQCAELISPDKIKNTKTKSEA